MDTDTNPWQGRASRVEFTGQNGTFRRIVINGAALELVTFGFYRFWLATAMRRYLWTSTRIDGDALEYTGRGKELLFGFLFAMAILGPFFLAYWLLGLRFEQAKAFASLLLYGPLFVFGQFAIYRARRYRLTRTVWRGIRFWMTGSGWAYALRSTLWIVLVVLTLGFAYPWRSAALERYKMRNTFYGNLPGRFDATGGALFARVWWIWVLGLIALGASYGLPIVIAFDKLAVPAFVKILIPFGVIALPFLYAAKVATEWRWWIGGIRFGGLIVACDLRRSALFGTYWKLIGMMMLVGIVAGCLFGGLFAMLAFGPLHGLPPAMIMAHTPYWAIAAFVILYILVLLMFGVVMRIYTLQRIWRRAASATVLVNPDSIGTVTAAGQASNALGEGLMDWLDFAGF
jgi:uncharacterized membrane protein YjgN (DUF898 family)